MWPNITVSIYLHLAQLGKGSLNFLGSTRQLVFAFSVFLLFSLYSVGRSVMEVKRN